MTPNVIGSLAITIERPGNIALSLPPGHRVVILARGARPSVAPITEPGDYEVKIKLASADASFPMIMTIVPIAMLSVLEALPQSAIDDAVFRAPTSAPERLHS